MKPYKHLIWAAALLSACGGNPFSTTTPVDPGDTSGLTVDTKVAINLRAIVYNPADGGSLQVNMNGLVGDNKNVTFVRNGALDVTGYEAYTFQNATTQRSFIALVANNANGTLRATTVSDGGQFNRHFAGGTFARLDLYTAPTGQFSYAGTYAGVFAPGTASSDLPAGLESDTPYRVSGDALINANFANAFVEGGVANRWLLDANGEHIDLNGDSVVDDEDMLPAITFPSMTIGSSGQFLGDVELFGKPSSSIGTVNGLFGGLLATDVAGAIVIHPTGDSGIWEHGVFNLPQCGEANASPLCAPNPLP